jgi:hypothetical protein
LIDETSTTRRLLYARIVDNEKDLDACISATIVHKRKGKNNQWEDVEAINLQKLKAGEGVRLHFSCTQLKKLREAIEKAYACGHKGVLPTGQYIFGKEDEFIIPSHYETFITFAGPDSPYVGFGFRSKEFRKRTS